MKKFKTTDIDELAGELKAWDQEYNQVGSGQFEGSLSELWLGDIQIYRETTKCALLERGAARDDSVYLVLPMYTLGDAKFNGQTVSNEDFYFGTGGSEWFVKSATEWDLIAITIPNEKIWDSLGSGVQTKLNGESGICVQNGGTSESARRLKNMVRMLFDLEDFEESPMDDAFCEMYIKNQFVSLLDHGVSGEFPTTSINDGMLTEFQRLQQRLGSQEKNSQVLSADLEGGASQRALQNYSVLLSGLPPSRLDRALRLNEVRRLLTDPRKDTKVLEAAEMHDFNHGGRFARYYAELFCENPSETVKTRPSQTTNDDDLPE